MDTPMQAGTIQRKVGITKSRYEYLRAKMAIEPEIELVEGTGRSNVYSFGNLLDFAIAHQASTMGLAPGAVKDLVQSLRKNHSLRSMGLYEPGKSVDVRVHYVFRGEITYYQFSGDDCDEQLEKSYSTGRGFDKMIMKTPAGDRLIQLPGNIQLIQSLPGDRNDADGYLTINLGKLKDRISR